MLTACVHAVLRANTRRAQALLPTRYVSPSLSRLGSLSWSISAASGATMTVDIPKDGKVAEDFVIASSARLQHISRIAKAAGLTEDEVIPHGLHKAKVWL